jgi:hypothetical protein
MASRVPPWHRLRARASDLGKHPKASKVDAAIQVICSRLHMR